jgi:hypothetical protein
MHDSQELQFINSTPSRMLLVIEPRSSEFWIESGATVRVLVRDPSITPCLGVEYLAGGLVVYASGNGQVEVYQNGRRLAQYKRTRNMAKKLVS